MLLNCRRFASKLAGRIRNVIQDDAKANLTVVWQNGQTGTFPYVWLRDNCPAPHTYQLTQCSNARKMILDELDLHVKPENIDYDSREVRILWPEQKPATYDSEWLCRHNLSSKDVRSKRPQVMLNDVKLWDAKTWEENCQIWDFEDLMTQPLILHDALTQLCHYGLIRIQRVRPQLGQLKRFSKMIGFHYATHYGQFFLVKTSANPTNIAYTSGDIGFHTDLPYLRYPPQIQCLHSIKQVREDGGETKFADGFLAAQRMEKDEPEMYKLLSTVPLEYIDDGEDYIRFDLTNKWPVFNFDVNGQLEHIQFSNQQRSWFYDCPMELIHKVYEAMLTFNRYLNDDACKLELKLNEGDLVIFANLRVLHGRRGFKLSAGSERLLEGCYFNWDVIRSKVRVLRDQLELEPNQISI